MVESQQPIQEVTETTPVEAPAPAAEPPAEPAATAVAVAEPPPAPVAEPPPAPVAVAEERPPGPRRNGRRNQQDGNPST